MRCGQGKRLPPGYQDNFAQPSTQHASDPVLCLLHVQTERLAVRAGLRTVALGSAVTMWSRRGQASAGWDPGVGAVAPAMKSRAASIPASWCKRPWPGFLPAHCSPGHVARWEPLTTARRGGRTPGQQLLLCSVVGAARAQVAHGSAPLTCHQTHFCGNQLGLACLPEARPGPHGGLQAALTLMSVCASGLFLPAKVPLDLAVPAPILPSPRLTPRGGK